MIPTWLHILSLASLGVAVICALWVARDVIRHPPHMGVMRLVWPICALFAGPLLVWFYLRHGRATQGHQPPLAISVAKGTLHCGAGCSLGDLLAESLVIIAPGVLVLLGHPGLFGDEIYAVWLLDFIFAFVIGIAMQYFAIAPMRDDLSRSGALKAAVKADTFSLLAWQIGMYGTMALAQFELFPRFLGDRVDATMPTFWFAMQIAMLAGFVTAYPVNWWLIVKGVKERM